LETFKNQSHQTESVATSRNALISFEDSETFRQKIEIFSPKTSDRYFLDKVDSVVGSSHPRIENLDLAIIDSKLDHD